MRTKLAATIAVVSIILLIVAPIVAVSQNGPILAPSDNPHENPHCSPRGSSQSVRCGCSGMVHQVQEAIVTKCWNLIGIDKPDTELQRFPPPVVLECLKKEDKAHCQVVARSTWQNENDYGITVKKPEHECKTTCRPEKCGCGDQACPMHGSPGSGY